MLIRIHVFIEPLSRKKKFVEILSNKNDPVFIIEPGQDIPERLGHDNSNLLIIDRSLLQEPVGEMLQAIRGLPDSPEVIVLTDGDNSVERASLLSQGVLAVLHSGLPDPLLWETLHNFVDRIRAQRLRELRASRGQQRTKLTDFHSRSSEMSGFLTTVRKVVSADSSLLILGETGVGKERLARSIHHESPRGQGPFITVDCAALPEHLLESELFGHVQGAFTGAIRSHRGYFELSHKGTIFLDEIGELSPHLQVKLLRVLQDHEIKRVGSEKNIEVDVRVIAATNRDLLVEMEANRFRRDLYYRLGVVVLTIPPLRDRREDIPDLVHHYLNHFRIKLRRDVSALCSEAMEALINHCWPGNIRELINVIERAVLLSNGPEILLSDLPDVITNAPTSAQRAPDTAEGTEDHFSSSWMELPWELARKEILTSHEKNYLIALLRSTGGRIGEAAIRAGINPRSLYDKMRKYGLKKENFRHSPRPSSATPRTSTS